MINSKMKFYPYYVISEETDAYGQKVLKPTQEGLVKINIQILSQSIADNIKYSQASYIGLTSDRDINDKWVIEYDDGAKLKVLYVNPNGKLRQVFLGDYL